jgi:hypothetical protein
MGLHMRIFGGGGDKNWQLFSLDLDAFTTTLLEKQA